jgi:hypothetical protein
MTTRMIVRIALVAAALSTAGAASAAVTLPAKANSHAVTATANVTTGSSNGQSGDVHPASTPSPNAHATFGQCVAANAKTASDNGGKGWNPTMGCTKTNAGANSGASANGSASTGLANAKAHANSHAAAGLQKASTASATGQAHAH